MINLGLFLAAVSLSAAAVFIHFNSRLNKFDRGVLSMVLVVGALVVRLMFF